MYFANLLLEKTECLNSAADPSEEHLRAKHRIDCLDDLIQAKHRELDDADSDTERKEIIERYIAELKRDQEKAWKDLNDIEKVGPKLGSEVKLIHLDFGFDERPVWSVIPADQEASG